MSKAKASSKQVKDLIKVAISQGWRVEMSKKTTHVIFLPPQRSNGRVVVPATPSDHRAMKNALALLRKAGLRT